MGHRPSKMDRWLTLSGLTPTSRRGVTWLPGAEPSGGRSRLIGASPDDGLGHGPADVRDGRGAGICPGEPHACPQLCPRHGATHRRCEPSQRRAARSAGRIVFGRLTRVDDIRGQLVSLYAIDPDGSDLVQLLDCEVGRPRFSPDGSRLAFGIAMDDGTMQIATMAADGSDLEILTSTEGYADTPDWSPDGSWLVYSHSPVPCVGSSWEPCVIEEGMHQTLWRMDADGSDQRLIGDPDSYDWEPRLSPDGREVVFTRIDPPTPRCALVHAHDPRPRDRRGAGGDGERAGARASPMEPRRTVDHLQHAPRRRPQHRDGADRARARERRHG